MLSALSTCGILTVMTSEAARVSDFSPNAFLQLNHICDLTVAMIDKIQVVLTCVIIRSTLCLLH